MISEVYKEVLIKRRNNPVEQLIKYLLIAITAFMLFLGFLGVPLLFGLSGLVILLCYFLFPRFAVEYEYHYLTGSIDVDKIMGKQKRKHLASYNLEKLVLLAPEGAKELERFAREHHSSWIDYTSRYPGRNVWILAVKDEYGQAMVKLELTEEIVEDIYKRTAPGKVILP